MTKFFFIDKKSFGNCFFRRADGMDKFVNCDDFDEFDNFEDSLIFAKKYQKVPKLPNKS